MDNALEMVYNAGARGIFDTATWQALEPTAGHFELGGIRDSTNYARARSLEMGLGIQVINTTAKETPPDLAGVPFNSPLMKARLRALIDALRPYLNKQVKYVSIGNEVDVYLAKHPSEWGAYKELYQDARSYLHAVAPGIKVGVTMGFDGAAGSQAADLTAASDVIILTYYPLRERYLVRPPSAPLADFPKMVALAKGRPVVLQEVGYPSAAQLGSSEALQAEFVTNVFAAWRAGGGSIPLLNFFVLHDLTARACDDYARYYGLPNDANFKAYLCSLGLRHANGTPKPAWEAFAKAAGQRP